MQNNPGGIPDKFSLKQNYPNPFNPVTSISFSIQERSAVTVTIYNSAGLQISQLINAELSAGPYNIEWNASEFASGNYFCRMTAGGFTFTKKIVLLK
ncbi:MAG TPA: T9SS type A sorting domain-containing protein [Ignavibacteria bacterium]|nr:T9SS type A sorting domain-containing protein [Ignavibacteria bacterium]